MELYSGDVYPDRCRSGRCGYCLPLNARRRAIAITYAAPKRMIRLSLAADAGTEDPCALALTRVGLIRRNLKRVGIDPGEWCWTIEANPKGTGYHAHCLQIGPRIYQRDLQDACVKAHAGWPHINYIYREGVWASRYGMKGFGADGYGLKKFRANGDSKEALRINHGRVEHHSKMFFAIEGDVMRVRDYERIALAVMNENKRVAYVGCAPDKVSSIIDNWRVRDMLIRDVNSRSVKLLRAVR